MLYRASCSGLFFKTKGEKQLDSEISFGPLCPSATLKKVEVTMVLK